MMNQCSIIALLLLLNSALLSLATEPFSIVSHVKFGDSPIEVAYGLFCVENTIDAGGNSTIAELSVGVVLWAGFTEGRGAVNLTVTSPTGTTILLKEYNALDTGSHLNVAFADRHGGDLTVQGSHAYYSSTTRTCCDHLVAPEEALSTLTGESVAGTWTLSACTFIESGFDLYWFGLYIVPQVSVPPTLFEETVVEQAALTALNCADDNDWHTVLFNVSMVCTVKQVEVGVVLEFQQRYGAQARLVSPLGTRVLFVDGYGPGENYNVELSSNAFWPLEIDQDDGVGAENFPERLAQPSESLGAFVDEQSEGTWQVHACDRSGSLPTGIKLTSLRLLLDCAPRTLPPTMAPQTPPLSGSEQVELWNNTIWPQLTGNSTWGLQWSVDDCPMPTSGEAVASIGCDSNGVITHIRVEYWNQASMALHGSLPSEIGLLSGLTSVYMRGTIKVGVLPSELGLLSELRWFYGGAFLGTPGRSTRSNLPVELAHLSTYVFRADGPWCGDVPALSGAEFGPVPPCGAPTRAPTAAPVQELPQSFAALIEEAQASRSTWTFEDEDLLIVADPSLENVDVEFGESTRLCFDTHAVSDFLSARGNGDYVEIVGGNEASWLSSNIYLTSGAPYTVQSVCPDGVTCDLYCSKMPPSLFPVCFSLWMYSTERWFVTVNAAGGAVVGATRIDSDWSGQFDVILHHAETYQVLLLSDTNFRFCDPSYGYVPCTSLVDATNASNVYVIDQHNHIDFSRAWVLDSGIIELQWAYSGYVLRFIPFLFGQCAGEQEIATCVVGFADDDVFDGVYTSFYARILLDRSTSSLIFLQTEMYTIVQVINGTLSVSPEIPTSTILDDVSTSESAAMDGVIYGTASTMLVIVGASAIGGTVPYTLGSDTSGSSLIPIALTSQYVVMRALDLVSFRARDSPTLREVFSAQVGVDDDLRIIDAWNLLQVSRQGESASRLRSYSAVCVDVGAPSVTLVGTSATLSVRAWPSSTQFNATFHVVTGECDAGFFVSEMQSFLCAPCEPGTYKAERTRARTCTTCELGQYQPFANASMCLQCPSNARSVTSGRTCQCTDTELATFELPFGDDEVGRCACDRARAYAVASRCEPCPSGARCFGNETVRVRSNGTILLFEDGVYSVRACVPASACEAGQCTAGYDGDLCATCAVGFFRQNGPGCEECPDKSYFYLAMIFILVLLLVAGFALWAKFYYKHIGMLWARVRFPGLSVAILYKFVISVFIFAQLPVEWPEFVGKLLRIVVVPFLSLGFGVSELTCIVSNDPRTAFLFKWLLSTTSMAVAFILLCVVWALYVRLALGDVLADGAERRQVLFGPLIFVGFKLAVPFLAVLLKPAQCRFHDDALVLNEEPTISCCSGNGLVMCATSVSLAALLCSVLLCVMVWMTLIACTQVDDDAPQGRIRRLFGLLTIGYRPSKLYWQPAELVVNLMQMVLTLLAAQDGALLAGLFLTFQVARLIAFVVDRPYQHTGSWRGDAKKDSVQFSLWIADIGLQFVIVLALVLLLVSITTNDNVNSGTSAIAGVMITVLIACGALFGLIFVCISCYLSRHALLSDKSNSDDGDASADDTIAMSRVSGVYAQQLSDTPNDDDVDVTDEVVQ